MLVWFWCVIVPGMSLLRGYRHVIPTWKCFSRLYSTSSTSEYEYLDSGNLQRIERFGGILVTRPCPSATWGKKIVSDWNNKDALVYDKSIEPGQWKNMNKYDIENWLYKYNSQIFKLYPSEQGQIGIFPEQHENWNWINQFLSKYNSKDIRVLNGFGYTGGSTLAALSGGNHVKVVHLDASKSSVKWAMDNVQCSKYNVDNCRFIVDDCITFLEREIRRGSKYECLIFDPPAFGRGLKGKKIWKLENDLTKLVTLFPSLLSDNKPNFVLLSCHDVFWSSDKLAKLLANTMTDAGYKGVVEHDSMVLKSSSNGNPLPLGSYARWISVT